MKKLLTSLTVLIVFLSFQSENRRVVGNVLISESLPEIEIKVAKEFTYVGSFPFEILALSEEYDESLRGKPVAGGDRFVFVAADNNKQVNKLFIVQLEGFFPDNNLIYRYNFSDAEYLGDNKFRHNTWFYNSKLHAEENPHGEGAKTRAFLEEKGYLLQEDFMMSRYVGLASKDKKNEIIIFYMEMLKNATGYSLDHYRNNLSGKEKEDIRNALIQRARKSFVVLKG